MKEDGRKNNGKTKEELLKISKDGTVSVSHDGFGFLSRGFALPNSNCELYPGCQCEKRCKAIDAWLEESETQLMNLPHVEDSDLFLVRQFLKFLGFQIVVDRWLERNDIVIEKDGDLKLQSIFDKYFILANSVQRLADRLGLSPAGRRQLKNSGKLKDIAATLAE